MKLLISISSNSLVIVNALSPRETVSEVVLKAASTFIQNMKKQFPLPTKKFKGIVFKRINTANYDQDDAQIRLPIFNMDKSLEQVDALVDEGHGIEGKKDSALAYGFLGLLVHEYGHHLNSYIVMSAKKKPILQDEWFACKKKLEKELGPTSEYSKKNTGEWFAERFVAEQYNLVSKVLIPIINEYVVKVNTP
jgi:hypothetical protein